MLQLLRLSALVMIVYVAFGAIGKNTTTAALAGIDTNPETCAADTLQYAVDAVDYSGAVLIANGEIYRNRTSVEIREEIALLPRYDDSDGISAEENLALELLLELGRQLAFAIATEELDRLLDEGPEGIRVASAGNEINFEVLEALRAGC